MIDQHFSIKIDELMKLLQESEANKPAGKELLALVLRPGKSVDNKHTYFLDALFSDLPDVKGVPFDIVVMAQETPVCPYPPGYGSGRGSSSGNA